MIDVTNDIIRHVTRYLSNDNRDVTREVTRDITCENVDDFLLYILYSLKDKTEINAPVWLALIIFISFLCFFALIYSLAEGWDYWTACYFTFITFTTIGLGDVVPEKTETVRKYHSCFCI